VPDLRHRLARAHRRGRVKRVGQRGASVAVVGARRRRLEGGAHRLQALEQRPALGAPPRREGGDGLALRIARDDGTRLGDHLFPLRQRPRPQADLPRPRTPLRDRLALHGVVGERPQARDRRGAGELAGTRERRDRATPQHEIHPQGVWGSRLHGADPYDG
jgi:hypothetical protein